MYGTCNMYILFKFIIYKLIIYTYDLWYKDDNSDGDSETDEENENDEENSEEDYVLGQTSGSKLVDR